MDVLFPKPGKGFILDDNNGLTLNFDPRTNVQKLESGIYIPKDGYGQGIDGTLDNWTIIPILPKDDAEGDTAIEINRDVVVCIFSLSRRKVTNRASVNQYTTSSETKTVTDVMDEFNCAMDMYKTSGQSIPVGLPATSYILTPGDLFQFREGAKPWIPGKNADGITWPCAMDDMNRYEDDITQALFLITEAEYNDLDMDRYLTRLSLKCIWKETNDNKFASYTVGQTYTASK